MFIADFSDTLKTFRVFHFRLAHSCHRKCGHIYLP